MNTEDYVTFEQAKTLKELGFDDNEYRRWYFNLTKEIVWVCIHDCFDYENMTQAPTLAQAQKWLREVKDVILVVNIKFHKGKVKYRWYIVTDEGWRGICDDLEKSIYDTYEEALSAGISRAIEILKKQNNGK